MPANERDDRYTIESRGVAGPAGEARVAVIRVRSELDRFLAVVLAGLVRRLAGGGASHIVLDLSDSDAVYRLAIAELAQRTARLGLLDLLDVVTADRGAERMLDLYQSRHALFPRGVPAGNALPVPD